MCPSFKSFTYHLSCCQNPDKIVFSLFSFAISLANLSRCGFVLLRHPCNILSRAFAEISWKESRAFRSETHTETCLSKNSFNGLCRNYHCGNTWIDIVSGGRWSKALSLLQAPHMAQEMVRPKRCPSPNQVSAEKLDTSTLPVSTSQQSTAPSPET